MEFVINSVDVQVEKLGKETGKLVQITGDANGEQNGQCKDINHS